MKLNIAISNQFIFLIYMYTGLITAERELAAIKEDRYVIWEWVCEYLGVTKPTAYAMLQD